MIRARPPKQAALLCGGLGSRLGDISRHVPKPLLPVAGRPFLLTLLAELRRHGIEQVVLLAAHLSPAVEAFAADAARRLALDIAVSVEPGRIGTAGALRHAAPMLDDAFFLINGDSWLDLNLLDLWWRWSAMPECLACLGLRRLNDAGRFGTVSLDGGRVTAFRLRPEADGPGLVNGGVYLIDRALVDLLPSEGSLEADVFPKLAASGRLGGVVYDGFFIDIGVPADYAVAQELVPARRQRPAMFFDRDGVLNRELGYVGSADRFHWMPRAQEAVKHLNDAGWYVFVVTNQAGVARGFYDEAAVAALHRHMAEELAVVGAHFDDLRYCPYHPEARIERYAGVHPWRKPAPGMLLDLMHHWPVDLSRSAMIGDQDSDAAAAAAAGIRAVHFIGDDLLTCVLNTMAGAGGRD